MANISDYGLDGVRATVAFYSMRQQNTENISEKILYDFLSYTCQSIWDIPAQLNPSLHLAHERDAFLQNPMEHLLKYSVIKYSSFGADAIKDTKDLIRQFLEKPPESGMLFDNHELKNVSPDAFFKTVCTYGMARELDSAIKSVIPCIPAHLIKAYPQWRRENDALFQIGKKGLPSTGELIATTLGKIAGENNHPTAKLIADCKRLGAETTDERIKKLYQDLIILADPFSAPLAVDAGLYQGLRPTFKSFFASIAGIHKHLNEQERAYVRDTLVSYMNTVPTGVDVFASMLDKRPETVATIRHRMMGVIADAVSPINLFQSLHLYGVADDFMGAVERGDVPEKIAKAYPKWKKESRTFIDKYSQSAPKNYAAVPEEIALFKQAEALSATVAPLSIALSKIENDLAPFVQLSPAHDKASSYLQRFNILLQQHNLLQVNLLGKNKYAQYIKEIVPANMALYNWLNDNFEHFSLEEKAVIKDRLLTIIHPTQMDKNTKETHIPREDGKGYITTRQLLNDAASDSLKEIKTPYNLFRIIHMYGLAEDFAELRDAAVIPPQMRIAYKSWAKVNQKFIAEYEKMNQLIEHRRAFTDKRDAATNSKSKRFNEVFRIFIESDLVGKDMRDIPTDILSKEEHDLLQNNWRVAIIQLVVDCQDILEAEDINLEYLKEMVFVQIPDKESEIVNYPLNKMDMATFFQFVKLVSAEDVLQQILATQNFPHVKFSDYETWAETGHMPVTVEVIDTPIVVDSRVTYIDVDHPLVTRGKRDEGMGYRPVDEGDQLDAGATDENPDRNRTEKIKDALLQDAASGVRHLTIRRDVRQMDCKSGRPYHLIDVDMEDGSRSRIAVCDFVGNMTFVERDAPDYIDGQTLDLEALRKNPKTWHVAHISDKQWIEGIQEVLYTPLDAMSPALKNKSYWYSLGDVAVQSLVTKFMIAGRAPPTVDTKTLIECGPLEGRSKYNLLYSAWNRGSIKGFEKGTTFSIVLKSLTEGEDAAMPWLKKFENKPQITAEAILAASERFKREWGFAAEQGFYDELKIDTIDARVKPDDADMRRTGIEADMAFKFRAVAVNDNDLQKWGRYPDGLDDFMQLAGVVTLPERTVA